MNGGKKRMFLVCGVLAAHALGVLVLWTIPQVSGRPENPVYSGKTLSEHLYTIYAVDGYIRRSPSPMTPQEIAKFQADERKRADSRKALGHARGWDIWGTRTPRNEIIVGPEALPLITNWMAST